MAEDLTSNGEPPKTGPSLAPYFLILFGASAGLGSIIVLLAEIRSELGFTDTGIGLAIAAGFAAAFVANISMAPQADRGRAPAMLRGGLALGVVGMVLLAVGTTCSGGQSSASAWALPPRRPDAQSSWPIRRTWDATWVALERGTSAASWPVR